MMVLPWGMNVTCDYCSSLPHLVTGEQFTVLFVMVNTLIWHCFKSLKCGSVHWFSGFLPAPQNMHVRLTGDCVRSVSTCHPVLNWLPVQGVPGLSPSVGRNGLQRGRDPSAVEDWNEGCQPRYNRFVVFVLSAVSPFSRKCRTPLSNRSMSKPTWVCRNIWGKKGSCVIDWSKHGIPCLRKSKESSTDNFDFSKGGNRSIKV